MERGGERQGGAEMRRRKLKYAKSMGGVEKKVKCVTKTDRFLTPLLTTVQFWTPEATTLLYFTY